MNFDLRFIPFTRDNWEEGLKLSVHPEQQKFAPTVAESLAAAYIKPWDEELDPYLIYDGDKLIGSFYLSYTPSTNDDYWLGGFIIDKKYQQLGYGKAALLKMLAFVPRMHNNCREIQLTVEKDNVVAQKLYKSLGFDDTGKVNKYGEIVYTIPVIDAQE